MTTKTKLISFIIAIALLATLFGMWSQYNINRPKKIQLQYGTLLPQPRVINPFKLIGSNGQPFTNMNLTNHYSLIFFGFTSCHSICPTTMSMLKQMYSLLTKAKTSTLPQVVLITVDPQRDTAAKLKQYVSSFNPAFLGATGSEKQIKALTHNMSILYMKVSNKTNSNYDIDHSGAILLINPQGQLAAIFSPPIDADQLANDYLNVIKGS